MHYTDTSEGLHIFMALAYYARMRFILNLLPRLQQASGLRRVVTVLAGGYEGQIDKTDFQSRHIPLTRVRGHNVSMTDLTLESLAQRAPEVSFVHDYPGAVESGFGREVNGWGMRVAIAVFKFVGPLFYVPSKESGERHLFFATSAMFSPASGSASGSGLPVPDGVAAAAAAATGTDGVQGSGVYVLHWTGESAGEKSLETLARLREDGMRELVWEHTMSEFRRVTGSECLT